MAGIKVRLEVDSLSIFKNQEFILHFHNAPNGRDGDKHEMLRACVTEDGEFVVEKSPGLEIENM